MGFEPGQRIGDYEVVGILGSGGMGQVYKVRNVFSKRVEAMKILLPDLEGSAQLAERFTQEMEVQAALEHPNIAPLHSAQRVGNQLLMTMEYVEGSSIESLLQSGPVPVDEALDFTIQVLGALAYAHARGVVHRDVKPANMIVTPGGVVKLLDFGVAKLRDRQLTQTGHTVGSLYYMAPEQISDPLNVDSRADLYSTGVALYQMATGQRPFRGESDYSIMSAHMSGTPAPPISIQPHLPEALNDAILMAIAKDRECRFQTAEAMRRALEGVRAELGPMPAWQAPAAATAAAGTGSSGAITATVAMPTPVPAPSMPGTPPQAPGAPYGAATPAPVRRTGMRGLYIAAGAVGAVLVLAVLAWKIPQMLSSRVQARIDASQETASKAQEFAQNLERDVTDRITEAVRNGDALAGVAGVHAPPRPPRHKGHGGRGALPGQSAPAAPEAPAGHQPLPPSPPGAEPEAGRDAAQAQAAAAEQQQQLREARRQLLALAVRARAAGASVQTLREQQARMGLGMRGDVTAAQAQLEGSMDEAQEAIRAADSEEAAHALKRAERALERLEKFLGR